MREAIKLKYFGWSSFGLESAQGTLYFDPFYRRIFGVSYATINDYLDAKVICVTHGHADHTVDVPAILAKTDAVVISSLDVTEHYKTKNGIGDDRLIALGNLEETSALGFKITAFEWGHKEGSLSTLLKLLIFKRVIFKGFRYFWANLRETPFNAIPMGFYIETPEGVNVLNYCEGLNDDTDFRHLEELGKRFDVDILIAGASMNWEEYVARGAAAISPKMVILYPPHDAPDKQWNLPTTPPHEFIKRVKQSLPDAEVIYADPGFSRTYSVNGTNPKG